MLSLRNETKAMIIYIYRQCCNSTSKKNTHPVEVVMSTEKECTAHPVAVLSTVLICSETHYLPPEKTLGHNGL